MPILQYQCPVCGHKFEDLVKKHDDVVLCPVCGKIAEREWSGCFYSATGKTAKRCNGNCKTCGGCG